MLPESKKKKIPNLSSLDCIARGEFGVRRKKDNSTMGFGRMGNG